MTGIETRLETLERENRRLKFGGLVILAMVSVGLALLSCAGSMPADEIRTRKLVVTDANGNKRISLGWYDGAIGVVFFNENGVRLAEMKTVEDGAGIGFYDSSGNTRTSYGVLNDIAMLHFSDKAGRPMAMLSDSPKGMWLSLHDNEGNPKAAMLVTQEGRPHIILTNSAGTPMWQAP